MHGAWTDFNLEMELPVHQLSWRDVIVDFWKLVTAFYNLRIVEWLIESIILTTVVCTVTTVYK